MTGRALERCVGDVDRFLERDWARAARHGENAGSFDDLLSLSDVDRILSTTLLRLPAFRLVKDGKGLDPASYTKSGRVGGRLVGDLADPGRVYAHFHDGATIVLQGLHRYWDPLTRFCRDLEFELTHPVQVNAYVTPPGSRGLAVHHDTHDVFVLQVFGSKHWDVYAPSVELPLASRRWIGGAAADGGATLSVTLQPGDCLYLPRGFPHAAASQDYVSVHLTVGVTAYTWHDVVKDILDSTEEATSFREPLPPGFADDAEGFRALVAERVEALQRWLGGLDTDAVADRMVARFWSSRPPLLAGLLDQLARLGSLSARSVVRRRPGSACQVAVADGALGVLLGDRRLTMPADLEPAMRWILGEDRFTVGDLAGFLDEGSCLVLTRRLVREGLLEVVSFD